MVNYVYIAASLDGFIATKDGGLDWLNEIPNPDQTDYRYAEFNSGIDAIVMGRNTFEKVLTFGFWPYDKPVFVLSHTLESVPDDIVGKAEIVKGDLRNLLDKLKKRGLQNLYIDGGRVIQSFLEEDLIDEMIITRVPILLGEGIPLFGKIENSLKFSLKKTEGFNETLVKNHYIRVREKNQS
ncbi:MAG: dihydrofolate reductase family protein [Candidatus Bathyarchaeota archaeon]|nr:dihydrofolate reductase family protein [Candidatus Bathyarchaeota archaeon]